MIVTAARSGDIDRLALSGAIQHLADLTDKVGEDIQAGGPVHQQTLFLQPLQPPRRRIVLGGAGAGFRQAFGLGRPVLAAGRQVARRRIVA